MRLGSIIMSQKIKLSRQGVEPGSPRPKKTQPSAGKLMATVFWEIKSDIMLDFSLKKRTITGEYYANLLNREPQSLRNEKRQGKLSKVGFCSNRTPLESTLAMNTVERNWYK